MPLLDGERRNERYGPHLVSVGVVVGCRQCVLVETFSCDWGESSLLVGGERHENGVSVGSQRQKVVWEQVSGG